VQNWCIANHVKLNAGKTKCIYFCSKTASYDDIKLRPVKLSGILRTDRIKNFGVFLTLNYFHQHVDPFAFSSSECLLMPHSNLVKSKLLIMLWRIDPLLTDDSVNNGRFWTTAR
jgi:hypothetical protein